MKVSSGEVRDMISECDPAGTGKITFTDFLTVLSSKLRNTDRAEVLLEAFQNFDLENKGYIPAPVLKKELQNWGTPLTDKEWAAMLAEIRCSETGLFDYKAFIASMMNTQSE